MKLHLLAMASVAAVVGLAGCTGPTQVRHEADAAYHQATAESTAYMQSLHNGQGTHGGPIISDVPYVSVTRVTHSSTYPAIFDKQVQLNQPPGQSMGEMFHAIEVLSGIRVTVDNDVLSGAEPSAAPGAPKGGADATLGLPASVISDTGGGDGGASAMANAPTLHYIGTLKGLFDQVQLATDSKCTYTALTNSEHCYRYETKVFSLATTPQDAKSTAAVGSSGQTVQGSSGQTTRVSGSDNNTEYGGDIAVWKSVGEAVKTMLSASGRVTLSQATGTLVVRDRYDHIDQIASYINQINSRLQLGVQVAVSVYRITINNTDNRGIDWNILYNNLGQLAHTVGGTIATTPSQITGATSMVLSAPAQNEAGKPNLFAGSQFFLSALSSLGNASVVTQSTALTTNDQPDTVKVVTSKSYLAESTSLYTNGVGGGSSGSVVGAGATLTPGSVETGFVMQVVPSVQTDGHHLLLQLSLSDSTLDALDTITSGGSSIQTPTVSSRQAIQRAWLTSGQTLVLAGFESTGSNKTINTPFGKESWGLGGNRSMSHTRDAVVIVVTPTVTNAAADGNFDNLSTL